MSSSVTPSLKYSLSGSWLRLTKGSTATDLVAATFASAVAPLGGADAVSAVRPFPASETAP